MRLNENITITGQHVVLVPYRREHVPRYHVWMQSEELQVGGWRGPRGGGGGRLCAARCAAESPSHSIRSHLTHLKQSVELVQSLYQRVQAHCRMVHCHALPGPPPQ
jgi:hypothetical protein